jgi:hypothetical protein
MDFAAFMNDYSSTMGQSYTHDQLNQIWDQSVPSADQTDFRSTAALNQTVQLPDGSILKKVGSDFQVIPKGAELGQQYQSYGADGSVKSETLTDNTNWFDRAGAAIPAIGAAIITGGTALGAMGGGETAAAGAGWTSAEGGAGYAGGMASDAAAMSGVAGGAGAAGGAAPGWVSGSDLATGTAATGSAPGWVSAEMGAGYGTGAAGLDAAGTGVGTATAGMTGAAASALSGTAAAGAAGGLGNILDLTKGVVGLAGALGMGSSTGAAASAADPFASQRAQYQKMLSDLMADPSGQLSNLPGYKAGLDAVQRSMASQGYTGSGNMMTALQQYGGNIFNQQATLLSGLAGATSGSPAAAGQIQQQGTNNAWNLGGQAVNTIANVATKMWG